jgi:hypothetical protein
MVLQVHRELAEQMVVQELRVQMVLQAHQELQENEVQVEVQTTSSIQVLLR